MPTIDVPTTNLLHAMRSSRWLDVRAAVQRAGELLRQAALSEAISEQLRERLLELTKHDKWEVRKAVAESIESVRDERFKPALSRMLHDDHEYVRDAARRALARSAALSRADLLKAEHDDLIAGWLSDLEAKRGPFVRDEAVRVARKYAELLVRESQHELTRVIAKLDLGLMNLETQLTGGNVDPAACVAQVTRARERAALLMAFLRSLRQITTEITPDFSSVSLLELVDEAASLVDRAKRERIALVINVRESIVIEADRTHLVAFSNVLQNAFEAYEPGAKGTIEVSARTSDNQVSIRIDDGGRGMAAEAQSDAFRLFSTSKQGGLGFGLPLARQIITRVHRGEIELRSKKGKGTTVLIVLPLAEEAE